ncbi:unnamed protein product [Cylindrotheca closterium]|uniref:Uncharacterized protein n=1 Tax=Cylindrotheca closterium TaxID=2856 RepID=A0AAD2FK42_9STRA|nr:unnamed protein product [Cylindrotheca closterium]
MTDLEKRRAQDAMMLLAEENTGEIEGRCVYKGDGTLEWLSPGDTSSPTAALEAIMITCVIDVYEGRDMMSLEISNAFIQTQMTMDAKSRVMMKITGLLVDMMIRLEPRYRDYFVIENGERVIYMRVLRAIYGMLEASMLWYKKLRGDMEKHVTMEKSKNSKKVAIAAKPVNSTALTQGRISFLQNSRAETAEIRSKKESDNLDPPIVNNNSDTEMEEVENKLKYDRIVQNIDSS